MNKISRRFAFVVGLNFKFGIYSISQVSGRFKKILKNVFSPLDLSLQYS